MATPHKFTIRKAQRSKAKARVAVAGPSGAGKTYSALLMAFGIVGPGGKVILLDSEKRSGDLYAHLGDYEVIELDAPYSPDKYIDAIKFAESFKPDCIIVDSLTHAWAGEGGILDIQGRIADSGKGNSYTAWRTVTPKHNQLVEAILESKCHMICTVRSKTAYVQQMGTGGKTEIKKCGMEAIQRDGLEYEFTVFLDIAIDHNASSSKDRTSLFDGRYFVITQKIGEELRDWLNAGTDIVELPVEPVIAVAEIVSDKSQVTLIETTGVKAEIEGSQPALIVADVSKETLIETKDTSGAVVATDAPVLPALGSDTELNPADTITSIEEKKETAVVVEVPDQKVMLKNLCNKLHEAKVLNDMKTIWNSAEYTEDVTKLDAEHKNKLIDYKDQLKKLLASKKPLTEEQKKAA